MLTLELSYCLLEIPINTDMQLSKILFGCSILSSRVLQANWFTLYDKEKAIYTITAHIHILCTQRLSQLL